MNNPASGVVDFWIKFPIHRRTMKDQAVEALGVHLGNNANKWLGVIVYLMQSVFLIGTCI